MKFLADLHVHSKFSIATSKNSDLENLYISAQLKGITVVGTGDFTHPGWFDEINKKLIPAEEGLYMLRKDIAKICDEQVPVICRNTVRFILTTEISNIYKKYNLTRKNHNLVIVPEINCAARFIKKLSALGNINSDGRPILGLDAKDLLNILLETSERSILIPAHIWTPWFSVLGSKSGFDSIEACFEDLCKYIFAVETGLSSDPAMNWQISMLDKYTLVSNSDAHSPMKLGREVNIFNTDLSYNKIYKAMKNGNEGNFLGTYEYYPEDGKYHLDGHRKCKIRLYPNETIEKKGLCPKCGKSLTLGVLYRVKTLADRQEGEKPKKGKPYYNSVPLTDILSEILKFGPQTQKVKLHYMELINTLGPELNILHNVDEESLKQAGLPLLAEAISRIRCRKINISPGFDGEFGKIQIFNPGEREKYLGQKSLFSLSAQTPVFNSSEKTIRSGLKHANVIKKEVYPASERIKTIKEEKLLNQKQLSAAQYGDGPLLIVAGPGTGKTRTLTHRISYIINRKGVLPEKILAITFTNKAAQEMIERIKAISPTGKNPLLVTTFHGLCYKILKEMEQTPADKNSINTPKTIIDEAERNFYFQEAVNRTKKPGEANPSLRRHLFEKIILAKQMLIEPHEKLDPVAPNVDTETLAAVYRAYQTILSQQGLYDFEDLIFKVVKRLELDQTIRIRYRKRFEFVFVDEYQDINLGQQRLLRLLTNARNNICAIGDPDQSIYGFRGSNVKYFKEFIIDYPGAEVMRLTKNYRSTQTIVNASTQMIKPPVADTEMTSIKGIPQTAGKEGKREHPEKSDIEPIGIIRSSSERAEAVAVGKMIENMVGGTGFHFMDFDKNETEGKTTNRGFSDFAILFRTSRQGRTFEAVLSAAGIPYRFVSRESLYSSKGIPQILSLLKMISGNSSFVDIDRLKVLTTPAITPKTLNRLISWSLHHKFTPLKALENACRYPVPGLGRAHQKRLGQLFEHLKKIKQDTSHMTVRQKLRYITEQPHINIAIQSSEKSKAVLNELLVLSKRYGKRLSDFINGLALQSDTDMHLPRAERVALMTMHAAKGLEFPVVFICGCENGYIPLTRSEKSVSEIEEERRLLYVAMTRAKEKLFLSYATKRIIYGKKEKRTISPFVKSIEENLTKAEAVYVPKNKNQIQLELF